MAKADPAGVLTGAHYMDGDHACCEGALAAGCRFVAGYPITPSTEVVERIAGRFPRIGDGVFIQMEDEIASSIAIQGAVWAGKKVMTVTSGPGLSLMMEHVGLAAMLEVPCVFVDVQRGGPSTGLPTLPGQADMMQVRWGSHGDYRIIAVCPNSPQEAFQLTFDAFNLAEKYRVPVFVMLDECVGHMIEKVVIQPADELEVVERKWTDKKPGQYKPYEVVDDTLVPPLCKAGDGYRIHTTGLTHDERGYPAMNWQAQEKLVHRLVDKVDKHADEIVRYVETDIENAAGELIADVVVFAYGITSRVAMRAMELARQKGARVGLHRPLVAWPFPEKRIAALAGKAKAIVVAEMNYGQMFYEVERVAAGRCPVRLVGHGGGMVHEPNVICNAILEAVR
ncbi:MAG: 2-oxoacid:acceptor oxidoreductase subunit alpha [Deltaproteobacteria bacterium]|nr:2-oxoacid:acceptor oxidoreductase subunit alpha [Deltaproteobacteria bacterium]